MQRCEAAMRDEGGGGGGKHKVPSDAKPVAPNNTKPLSVWGVLGGDGHHHHNAKPLPRPWASRDCKSFFTLHRLGFLLFLLSVSLLYFLHTYNLLFSPLPSCPVSSTAVLHLSSANFTTSIGNGSSADVGRSSPSTPVPIAAPRSPSSAAAASPATTGLQHIVFGIAASAKLWEKRKAYIKVWWRPRRMRGFVWLDKPVKELKATDPGLPLLKISGDTSRFPYTHRKGDRSAIRISRIVSETFRLRLPNVRWFVMGDDDTVFFPDNLACILSRFDHRQPYYIGSHSESHLQNIYFSYNMAYGGGGFAISAPLAAALARVQDKCLYRYPALYGSDDRIQACMAELGVPLTRHPGFHQYDVYGDLLGLLAAHPVAPLISLHHLDVVQPLFPGAGSRAAAIRRLFDGPVRLDSGGVMQQSICYERRQLWTVSVAWGFAVTVVRGVMSPREMEMPARTFLNWYPRADYTAYAFNTRPVARNPCQKPFVYYLASARYDNARQTTVTEYKRHRETHPLCKWRMADPSALVDRIVVHKKPDPGLWDRAPRRNCCRVLSSPKDAKKRDRSMVIDVGTCQEDEISGIN
ncbi:unnamed protein product [Musa acuminata subsp. malaccensis]|uniref:(wild Malaysian banana) hypothetical protein n=1 Tax=Musa acuminata subsp. malaccensis TaxID=214687 RepID=A0A804HY19_MUSAM|nr:PREDICTED: uncharacterized protein LOC103968722 [Musa acuminata subsp. malaccensis]CAG1860651.1 unnamed protein product [Musa acuminata subsp. malaccensis]